MNHDLFTRVQRAVLASVLGLLLANPISRSQELPPAPPEEAGLSAAKLARITPAVQGLITNHQVAGAVVMIARHGKTVYCEAFGQCDLNTGQPMRPDTIMRIYSMTKPVTSVAVMMLVDEGKIGLDDPVAKHLPELRVARVFTSTTDNAFVTGPARREPTVRDLLRHTGGLTYGYFGNTPVDAAYVKAEVLKRDSSLADLTRKLARLPLAYQPGSAWRYSVSADVLGRLVEVVSGKSFDAFLTERIFRPLDMRDTGFFVPSNKVDRFSAVHGSAGAKLTVIESPTNSVFLQPPGLLSGGGGLVSTARDYMRFCQMVAGGGELNGRRLLRPETAQAMTTNQLPAEVLPISLGPLPMPGIGFGLGFSVQMQPGIFTGAHVGEYGWSGIASTAFWISPKDDLIVIVLQQFMPFSMLLDQTVKPLVYQAITE